MFKERSDRHKVAARISVANYDRLTKIAHEYNFRTVNDLLSYLVFCFLRAVDEGNDELVYPMPDDILKLFPVNEDIHDVQVALAKVKRQRLKRTRGKVTDEIGQMFDQCEELGASLEFAHNIRERGER
mgnify:CR=1 FL=1